MSKLTKEEIQYIRHLLDVRYWKLDKYLQKAGAFEIELLLREAKQVASLQNKFLNLWEKE